MYVYVYVYDIVYILETIQILIPMEMRAIPKNDNLLGIRSRKHKAANVVNRNVHDCVIGTANEMSESCKKYTYNKLPL